MAFKDTDTMGEAMRKAVKLGATHFYKMYAGNRDKELFSIWFFKGNNPLSIEQAQALYPYGVIKNLGVSFHEIANYGIIMKSFNHCERINGLVTRDQLIPIDAFYFDHIGEN